jgi:hypothetical protein
MQNQESTSTVAARQKPAVAKLARNRYTVLVGSPGFATSAGINPLEA